MLGKILQHLQRTLPGQFYECIVVGCPQELMDTFEKALGHTRDVAIYPKMSLVAHSL